MRYLSLLLLITSISIFGMHHEKLDVIVFAIDLEIIDGQKNSASNFVSRITNNVKNKEPQTLVYQYHFSKEENALSTVRSGGLPETPGGRGDVGANCSCVLSSLSLGAYTFC